MRRSLLFMVLPLSLALGAFSCSDDDDGPGPGSEAGTAVEAGAADSFLIGDAELPWPDLPVKNDTTPWSCTPGEANMCDGYKTHYCDNGTCAPCPANYVDCDRSGDCECLGACDGSKCVKPGG